MEPSTVFQRIKLNNHLSVPNDWQVIRTIDMHTGGEPLRVILNGFPVIQGNSVLESRKYIMNNYDHLRTALMHEPRGHADMYGCLLVPPNDDTGDFGIIFIHNDGYSTMCGHAIIAIATLAVKMKWVKVSEPQTIINIDAPCGRIKTFVHIQEGVVKNVSFYCVPSFVVGLNLSVAVPSIGIIQFDLAYGGAFYAYLDATQFGLRLDQSEYSQIIHLGKMIKQAIVASDIKVIHPFEQDLSFLYGTIFIGPSNTNGVDNRNVCVFADGEVDRCPTGSGVSGRMALHFQKGEIKVGETMNIESITGSVFKGRVHETTTFGPYDAVIPEVTGTASVTGQHEFIIDPDDPFQHGFFLR